MRRNTPAQSRNSRKPVTNQNDMVRKGRANPYVRRFPSREIDMDVVCHYSTIYREMTNEEKKVNHVAKTADVERKEIKQTWRKKPKDKSMDRNCAFNAQVISPKA